jgi:hypothetical protein
MVGKIFFLGEILSNIFSALNDTSRKIRAVQFQKGCNVTVLIIEESKHAY